MYKVGKPFKSQSNLLDILTNNLYFLETQIIAFIL